MSVIFPANRYPYWLRSVLLDFVHTIWYNGDKWYMYVIGWSKTERITEKHPTFIRGGLDVDTIYFLLEMYDCILIERISILNIWTFSRAKAFSFFFNICKSFFKMLVNKSKKPPQTIFCAVTFFLHFIEWRTILKSWSSWKCYNWAIFRGFTYFRNRFVKK